MQHKPTVIGNRQVSATSVVAVPAIIRDAGADAIRRFIEFFTANIRNVNTRLAYLRAVRRFTDWAEVRHISLAQAEPILVAAYVEELQRTYSDPSVKQQDISTPSAVAGLDNRTLKSTTPEIRSPIAKAINGSDVLALHFSGSGDGPEGDGSVTNCAGFSVGRVDANTTGIDHGWSIFYIATDHTGEPEL